MPARDGTAHRPRRCDRGSQRVLGQIRSQLEYRPIMDLLNDLSNQMDIVQEATSTAFEVIGDRYLLISAVPT